ncbi:stimulated by retinoic acid gene 6 protein-like [Aplysia californica]|uniref:Receptor for retinol uptake STRA6 n=1 Tax=Aplysia californica TaxID=6500 RepID=A0ABM1VQM8_APLCA|nr:stimulated by retinoic acid gene 6 protein-like [Aplysia californica]XP_005094799.1 stimulated by retinoic acid gene 6 protein-like [Aplysia californica]XP_005094800.1 stimulated by retinoic acid gene 6 protein-like [Aplysia californica]XP_035824720.1 stimulated by retinoic acid gene 6 protein-like [Aplysia californica]
MALDGFNLQIINYYVLIPVSFIILYLSLLEKRKCKHRNCCNGRPGLIVPFHFLDGYGNRLAYALALGTTTNTVVSLITSKPTLEFDMPLWLKAPYFYMQALIGCLTCFPLLASITTRYTVIGSCTCILYSLTWGGLSIVQTVKEFGEARNRSTFAIFATFGLSAPSENDTAAIALLKGEVVMGNTPVIMCYLGLILISLWNLYHSFVSRTFVSKRQECTVWPHQEAHVKWLLSRSKIQAHYLSSSSSSSSRPSFISEMEKNTRLRLFKNYPFFRYPTKILVMAFVQLNVIYWMMTLLIVAIVRILETYLSSIVPGDESQREVFAIISGCSLFSLAASISVTGCQIFIAIRSYRYHMLRIYAGDRSFMPKIVETPQVILTRSMSYPGYQVAFVMWGFVISFVALMLITNGLSLTIYYLSYSDLLADTALNLVQLLSFPATVLLFFYLQVLLTKKVLMQEKVKENDENKPLNVDNRKFFEIVNFYSLFTNMAVGLFTCLLRILKSAFFGIFTVGRLDHSVFTRNQESSDKGFKIYLSVLLVDNAHNNPTMRVFAHLLWTKVLSTRYVQNCPGMDPEEDSKEDSEEDSELLTGERLSASLSLVTPDSPTSLWTSVDISDRVKSRRARTRWVLAFTLINNPQLQKLRKHALAYDLMLSTRRSELTDTEGDEGLESMERNNLTGILIDCSVEESESHQRELDGEPPETTPISLL